MNDIIDPKTLSQKIEQAKRYGRRYTPTREEWDQAPKYLRREITWPQDILDWIRNSK